MKNFIFILISVTIMLRPAMPSLLVRINDAVNTSEAPEHCWLVQQLLKNIQNEKEKIPELVQASVENSTLHLPEAFQCLFLIVLLLSMPSADLVRRWQNSYFHFIFQPPKRQTCH